MDSRRRVAAIALAYRWASRCFTIAIGMLIPGFLGYWADEQLGTKPLLLMGGFALGFAYGIWRLMTLIGPQNTISTQELTSDPATRAGSRSVGGSTSADESE